MTRTLGSVAHEVEGRLIGADGVFDVVSTDTRTISQGSLFVAIVGDRFDGNDFRRRRVQQRRGRCARVALGRAPSAASRKCATRALLSARMARAWRATFEIPVVAVTGSSGKTTVKELIAAILAVSRNVCVTQGNLNNDIGVPLTLMRLDAQARRACRRARREPRRRDRIFGRARAADRRRDHERGPRAPGRLRLARRRGRRQGRAARCAAAGRHGGAQCRR